MSGWAQRLADIRRQFKPADVEEPIDYWFHRPLAGVLVQWMIPLPITPTQVTLLSGVIGALSGYVLAQYSPEEPLWALGGAALLLFSVVLDCADGQLARARNEASVVGRAIDGMIDVVAPFSMFLGMAHVLHDQMGFSWTWLHLVGWPTGISLFWHVNQYDHAKNLFLHHSKPPVNNLGDAAFLDMEELRSIRDKHRAEGAPMQAFLVAALMFYMGLQGARSDVAPEARSWSPERRKEYRDGTLNHMRRWTWMGLGTHLFVLNLGAIGLCFDVRLIVVIWAVFLIPLNAVCIALLWQRRGLHTFASPET
jgi:phosphatidylglycerophosphate synthase